MKQHMTWTLGRTAVMAIGLWLFASPVGATTVTLDCDAGGTISGTISRLKAGDTLAVTGSCREKVRIESPIAGVTLDGQGKTTIQGTGPQSDFMVFISAGNITIKGFRITGGQQDGIHLSGPASAIINGNVIEGNGRGIHVDKGSIVRIVNNTIQNNRGIGINIQEHSYARIGFNLPTDKALQPNTIQNNEGHGIHIWRSASAWIVGNTIAGNKGGGVVVNRNSQADIVGNTIKGNSDGIAASQGSGINLASDYPLRREGPNQTDAAMMNSGVGIRCSIGGYVVGPLGTLAGAKGTKEFDNTCVDRVTSQ